VRHFVYSYTQNIPNPSSQMNSYKIIHPIHLLTHSSPCEILPNIFYLLCNFLNRPTLLIFISFQRLSFPNSNSYKQPNDSLPQTSISIQQLYYILFLSSSVLPMYTCSSHSAPKCLCCIEAKIVPCIRLEAT